jgi:hypothetical protein
MAKLRRLGVGSKRPQMLCRRINPGFDSEGRSIVPQKAEMA